MLFFIFLLFPYFTEQASLKSSIYNWDKMTEIRSLPGKKRSFFEGNTAIFSYLEVHATTLFEGNRRAPAVHIHPEHEELIIVKEGLLEASMNDKKILLSAGSVALVCKGDKHIVSNGLADKNSTYFIFRWKTRKPLLKNVENKNSSVYNWNDIIKVEADKQGSLNILQRPTSLLTSFSVNLITLKTGSVFKVSTQQEKIFLIKSGFVRVSLSGKNEMVSRGSMIFVATNDGCILSNDGDMPCEIYSISYK